MRLVRLYIVVGKPEASDACPEGTGEFGQGMEVVVVHNLVDNLE